MKGKFTILLNYTPSNRGRMPQSIKELNNRIKNDKMVKILLIIDIPPRILANVICPQLYIIAYTHFWIPEHDTYII